MNAPSNFNSRGYSTHSSRGVTGRRQQRSSQPRGHQQQPPSGRRVELRGPQRPATQLRGVTRAPAPQVRSTGPHPIFAQPPLQRSRATEQPYYPPLNPQPRPRAFPRDPQLAHPIQPVARGPQTTTFAGAPGYETRQRAFPRDPQLAHPIQPVARGPQTTTFAGAPAYQTRQRAFPRDPQLAHPIQPVARGPQAVWHSSSPPPPPSDLHSMHRSTYPPSTQFQPNDYSWYHAFVPGSRSTTIPGPGLPTTHQTGYDQMYPQVSRARGIQDPAGSRLSMDQRRLDAKRSPIVQVVPKVLIHGQRRIDKRGRDIDSQRPQSVEHGVHLKRSNRSRTPEDQIKVVFSHGSSERTPSDLFSSEQEPRWRKVLRDFKKKHSATQSSQQPNRLPKNVGRTISPSSIDDQDDSRTLSPVELMYHFFRTGSIGTHQSRHQLSPNLESHDSPTDFGESLPTYFDAPVVPVATRIPSVRQPSSRGSINTSPPLPIFAWTSVPSSHRDAPPHVPDDTDPLSSLRNQFQLNQSAFDRAPAPAPAPATGHPLASVHHDDSVTATGPVSGLSHSSSLASVHDDDSVTATGLVSGLSHSSSLASALDDDSVTATGPVPDSDAVVGHALVQKALSSDEDELDTDLATTSSPSLHSHSGPSLGVLSGPSHLSNTSSAPSLHSAPVDSSDAAPAAGSDVDDDNDDSALFSDEEVDILRHVVEMSPNGHTEPGVRDIRHLIRHNLHETYLACMRKYIDFSPIEYLDNLISSSSSSGVSRSRRSGHAVGAMRRRLHSMEQMIQWELANNTRIIDSIQTSQADKELTAFLVKNTSTIGGSTGAKITGWMKRCVKAMKDSRDPGYKLTGKEAEFVRILKQNRHSKLVKKNSRETPTLNIRSDGKPYLSKTGKHEFLQVRHRIDAFLISVGEHPIKTPATHPPFVATSDGELVSFYDLYEEMRVDTASLMFYELDSSGNHYSDAYYTIISGGGHPGAAYGKRLTEVMLDRMEEAKAAGRTSIAYVTQEDAGSPAFHEALGEAFETSKTPLELLPKVYRIFLTHCYDGRRIPRKIRDGRRIVHISGHRLHRGLSERISFARIMRDHFARNKVMFVSLLEDYGLDLPEADSGSFVDSKTGANSSDTDNVSKSSGEEVDGQPRYHQRGHFTEAQIHAKAREEGLLPDDE